jgi:hypothetical protein
MGLPRRGASSCVKASSPWNLVAVACYVPGPLLSEESDRVELFAEPLLGSPVGLLGQLRTPSVVEGSRSQWFGGGYYMNMAAHLFCSTTRLSQLETRRPGG